jgi:hypothetical protein
LVDHLNSRSFPVYVLAVAFLLFSLPFPDRLNYLASAAASVILFLSAFHIGKRIIREEEAFYAPFGLGVILLVSYVLFIFSTTAVVRYAVWIILAILSAFEVRLLSRRLPLKVLWASPLILLGFWSCLTPSTFFDALAYHLGLPYQYLASGQMILMKNHLYSSFPPFDQVLNLLFIGARFNPGIKIFSMILLICILWTATTVLKGEINIERMTFPLLMLPNVWILIHLVTADLLTALFFCSGVFLLLAEENTNRTIVISSALIALSFWTKANVLLYVPPIVILCLKRRTNLKQLIIFFGLVFLFILPLLIRNYIYFGDPFYPVLSRQISNANWSAQQDVALSQDSFPPRARTPWNWIKAPFDLIRKPALFGSASEVGVVPIISILLYPLAARSKLNRILVYVFICFIGWLLIFPNFRQFFPVFLLLAPVFYAGWNFLANRSTILYAAGLIVCAVVAFFFLYPIYRYYFPLIKVCETQQQYLREHLDYYPAAELANRSHRSGILFGDTRTAYYEVPLVAGSAYDRSPFLELLRNSRTPEIFAGSLKKKGISFVVIHRAEFNRLAKKNGIWKISTEEAALLQTFLKNFTNVKYRKGMIYYLELK